jgi:hypothetical protein
MRAGWTARTSRFGVSQGALLGSPARVGASPVRPRDAVDGVAGRARVGHVPLDSSFPDGAVGCDEGLGSWNSVTAPCSAPTVGVVGAV